MSDRFNKKVCYNSPAFIKQKKLTQHGFEVYFPEQLECLMHDAGFIELDTITTEGGTGKGLFYCTVGVVAQSKQG